MPDKRRRFVQTVPLEERLSEEAARLRAEARTLPPGHKRDVLLRRARQDEIASHLSDWIRSPGLKPPV